MATVSYADSFYLNVNRSNPSLPTFAYPTTVTDPDGFTATTVYNYDMGAATQAQTPLPGGATQPPVTKSYYDAAGRVIKALTVNNGAYTRIVYQPSMELVQAYALLEPGVETYSGSTLDGAGRVRAKAATHPNSAGGYTGQIINYDPLGRVASQSNPTETDTAGGTWAATGIDATANGGYWWLYTQSTYDWKGRPLQITNTDNSTKEFLYGGCGCAGGEVVTTRDEVGRRQKVSHDALGRVVKTQVLTQQDKSQPFSEGTDADVYSTVTNAYDALDRVTQVTDGRGAVTTYGYTGNNRRLVTGVSSTLSGVTVSASFGYDAAGNRVRMDDAQGWQTYSYDSQSRPSSETRYFNNLGASYSLPYSYNAAGQLKTLTDPFGAQITYTRDAAGRLTDVADAAGTPYAGAVNAYVRDARYRAWGGVRSASFGDGSSETVSYDARMRPAHYELTGTGGASIQREDFAYYGDGRLQTLTDLDDGQGSSPPSTYHFFSRSYTYDHLGRVLHGGGVASNSPFQQDYTYDEFDDLTSRSGSEGWNAGLTDKATYTNGRRDGWTYDADGRLTLSPANTASNQRTWSYDAAGRLTSTVETNSSGAVTLSEDYDGDGQAVREAQTGGSTPATYYLVRSSVLGGEVATRLTAAGVKAYTYVPAEGLLYARQAVQSFNGQASLEWTHRDPLGVSEPGAAYDPLGNYVSPVNPQRPGQPPPTMGAYGPGYGGAASTFGNAENFSTGCMAASNNPSDCNSVMQQMNQEFWDNLPHEYLGGELDRAEDAYVTGLNMSASGRDTTGGSGVIWFVDPETHQLRAKAGFAHFVAPGSQLDKDKPKTPTDPGKIIDDAENKADALLAKGPCASWIEQIALEAFTKITNKGKALTADEAAAVRQLAAVLGGIIRNAARDIQAGVVNPDIRAEAVRAPNMHATDKITYYNGFFYDQYHNQIRENNQPSIEYLDRSMTEMAQSLIHEGLHLLGAGFTDAALGELISGKPVKGKNDDERRKKGSQIINDAVAEHCK